MQPKQLLIKALDNRRQKYRQEFNRARADFSEEAVHDLRVATRRILALLDLLRLLTPELPLKPIRRELKTQLDNLDRLRDTQVMLVEVRERMEILPSLASFQAYLEGEEQQALVEARKALGEINFVAVSRLNSDLLGLRQQLAGRDGVMDPLSAADAAFGTVTQRFAAVEPAVPPTFHSLRVAFKKFRYTVEILHSLAPGFPRGNLKLMGDYQTALGRIQDAEVMLAALGRFVRGDKTFDPTPVREFYEQRHGEVIAAVLVGIYEVHTFWRAAPEGPFAWEQTS
jgi:CHAD domain-containing protein